MWESIIIHAIGKQPSTKSAKGEYLSQFPAFFHSYINDIVDVVPDGNCGFRFISSALGWGEDAFYDVRRQLHTQIQQHANLFSKLFYDTVSDVSTSLLVKHLGEHGKEKWMSIPDMSYCIASRYIQCCICFSFDVNEHNFFFPLHIAPPPYTS
ncbi:uncharacterized protein LOC131647810 [Vicia villosa]|uniref:uncharacterized protein LOC131647810 n=1 Tax=Vicia villosa TaxID=3911 RepID=UPI00273C20CA|nr:uncharacterized protein LOC131647810 [Vicia villosa]